MTKRDIIFVAMENWDEVWRRNQPVAAGFAARAPGQKVLFVGLDTDVSHLIRKMKFKRLLDQLFGRQNLTSPPGFENIYLLNCTKWLPNSFAIGRLLNRWWGRMQIRAACRSLGMNRPLLWINPYYSVHLLGKVDEEGVVYDVGDDWTSFPQPSEWMRELVVHEDNELTRRADVVIVVSRRLYEMKLSQARRLLHIPNGVYVERYAKVADRALPPHPITRGWTHPVLGYSGSIHQDRVNVDMIVALAKAFPRGTIALVGPNMLDADAMGSINAHPNIKLPGPVEFAEMPQVMSAFDVCIVPHLVNNFTESLSPLKLYEYLASGLPTVSTPVSGFRDFPELVHLASDNDSFVEAVSHALAEPPDTRGKRQAVAQQHSWDARMDEIEAAIAPLTTARQATIGVTPAHAF
ncbi:MAG: glycosyltransferase [Planctomycetota bacterium]|nr:glycosyltransferase [Planctomycetota bacterium]